VKLKVKVKKVGEAVISCLESEKKQKIKIHLNFRILKNTMMMKFLNY